MFRTTPSSDRAPRRGGLLARLALGIALASAPIAAVQAQDAAKLLDAPRAAGQVGERFDGYAVARGTVSASVNAIITQVNNQRRGVYEQRAKAQNVTADAVGRIYAAEIIRLAPTGTWFLAENGNWTQK